MNKSALKSFITAALGVAEKYEDSFLFFKILFIYLFDLRHCMQDLHCIMQDLSLWRVGLGAVAPGLQSMQAQ